MGVTIRKSSERGYFDHGWLKTYHTFSFGQFYDPNYTQFRSLRVINEDVIAEGSGFPEHPHRDMEILTYVVSGALAHKDTLGTASVIRENEAQIMSAGTGIYHSEYNALSDQKTHILQLWITPEKTDLKPRYDQRLFRPEDKHNRLLLIASKDGRDGSLQVFQDVDIYAAVLSDGTSLSFKADNQRYYWVQLISGALQVNGLALNPGDGLSCSHLSDIHFESTASSSEFLLFDLS